MPLEHVPQRSAIWLRGAAFAANYVKNSLIHDSDRLRAEAPGIGLRPLQGNAINCIPTWAPSLSPIANKNPQEPDLEARGEALLKRIQRHNQGIDTLTALEVRSLLKEIRAIGKMNLAGFFA